MKIAGYFLFTGLALLDYLTAQFLIRHWGWVLIVFGGWCIILNLLGTSSDNNESRH